jgi:hypothetical protein
MEEIIKIDTSEALKVAEESVAVIADTSRIKVVSMPTLDIAKSCLGRLKEVRKAIEEKKKSITDPLNLALKNTRSLFTPIEDKLDTIEGHLKDQVVSYNNKLLKEQADRVEKAKDDIKKGKDIDEATKKLSNTQEKIKAVPTMSVLKVKIVDFSKVDDKFKTFNEQEAKAFHRANPEIKVEGLYFYTEEVAVNRF